ncbi:hypothetical protein QJU89_02905 [Pasteurella skyensis]|uniref:Outer membrane usher protein FimD/PapC n=1 Tax=Phocoenobacter skyensis TaxID=97481 RepID=A0AAJ6N8X7_9PAST|nr:hypothetical protein [Pasteurella skyensis]MDP8162277.1 hypothetical protein [Pasteurella skyensis]MDP8172389.1 hypothetical protein [Pasteurella skyensis]MDP8176970.1 hypothetical protein [Pasteurella skyensis]MDP8178644.1 hypothetical protein [Pasteurella skyensis]MDP8182646.1 hypothetical protein [Pasteurella skyensis]
MIDSIKCSTKHILSYALLFTAIPNLGYAQQNANINHSITNEIALVGLFVNDKEITNIDVLKNDKGYYLPLDLIVQEMGISPSNETVKEWQFHLPLGDANIPKTETVSYQNSLYLPLNALKSLGINAVYNQSLLAIKLYIPWNSKNPFAHSKVLSKQKKASKPNKIDFYPKLFGLGGITVQGNANLRKKGKSSSYNNGVNIGLVGYLSGGLWGADLNYQNQINQLSNGDEQKKDSVSIDNLYWVKAAENWALRVGNSRNSYGLSSDRYTGITFAYSNKSITKHLAYAGSGSQQLLSSNHYSSIRNIEGIGPAGGIAELRVNGRPIARVRIALDKKYQFIGLNLANYDANNYNVEVAIFEYSVSEAPIEIYKPFLSTRRSNVATDEVLIEAGLGRQGNSFSKRDSVSKSEKIISHLYGEYGLTNNIAVRGSVTKLSGESHLQPYEKMFGLNIGLPFNVNLDLSYQNLAKEKIYDSYLNYNNDYFSINYNYQRTLYKQVLSNIQQKRKTQQHLNINLHPTDYFNLGLQGNYNKIDTKETDKYFTAYLNARPHKYFGFNIHRDRNNDYHYGINWDIIPNDTHINADWDQDKKALHISKKLTENLDAGASVTHWEEQESSAYRAYLDYEYNDKHQFYTAIGYYDEQNSYDFNWQYRPNDYGSIRLGYHKNQLEDDQNIDNMAQEIEDEDYFYLQFSVDFLNQDDSIDFGRYKPSHYGTVIANLNTNNPHSLQLDKKVQFKLDNYLVDAYKMADNQYRVENIKEGIYKLTFPTGNLPLEYQSNNLPEPIIKVSKAAPTIVDYKLEETFGISGQLLTEKENVKIEFYKEDKKVTETYTGAYGYYQVIGLPKGEYMIKIAGKLAKKVTVKDAILFDVNL